MGDQSALARAIQEEAVAPGALACWWLGQMGLVVKTHTKLLVFDPFLSPHPSRLHPAPLAAEHLCGATLIFGSHDHDDHIDLPAWQALARQDAEARFAVPALVIPQLARRGFDTARLFGVDDGATLHYGGMEITGVASSHELPDRDPQTGQYPYMGFLVRVDGFTLYHPGDTCRYDGLAAKLQGQGIDLCVLPINGRDAPRYRAGILGNMTWQEAADLAGDIAPGLVMPGHFDMIEGNTTDPAPFVDYLAAKYPGLACHVPACGRLLRLAKGPDGRAVPAP